MPTLAICRAEPFCRGDESISIWMDGKAIGTLPKTGALTKEIPAGAHKLQAWMNGSPGRKMLIQACDGEGVSLVVSNTKMQSGSSWEWVGLMLIFMIPGEKFPAWGVWVHTGLFVVLISWSVYSWFKRNRNFLKIEPSQALASIAER